MVAENSVWRKITFEEEKETSYEIGVTFSYIRLEE